MGHFSPKTQKGQTLIEVLAAFGIAVSLVTAITVTIIFALSTTQSSKNTNTATQNAQQGMEIVRRMQNLGGLQNLADDTYCLSGGGSLTEKGGLPNCPSDTNTFVREVIISESSLCAPAKQVTLDVYWSDNKCRDPHNPYCHKTEVSSCLSSTSNVPTPGQSVVSATPSPTPYPSPALTNVTNNGGTLGIYWTSVVGAISYNVFSCGAYFNTNCVPSNIWINVTTTTQNFGSGSDCSAASYYYNFAVQAVFSDGGTSPKSNVLGAWGGVCQSGDDDGD